MMLSNRQQKDVAQESDVVAAVDYDLAIGKPALQIQSEERPTFDKLQTHCAK